MRTVRVKTDRRSLGITDGQNDKFCLGNFHSLVSSLDLSVVLVTVGPEVSPGPASGDSPSRREKETRGPRETV